MNRIGIADCGEVSLLMQRRVNMGECTIDCVKSIVAQGILLVAYVEVKQYS